MEVEPILAPLFVGTILQQRRFEHAVLYRIAARLANETHRAGMLFGVFCRVIDADPTLGEAFRADILAVIDRDPTCHRLIEPLLYFKGFHAIQSHRIAYWLWDNRRTELALSLQHLSSQIFQTDIRRRASVMAFFSTTRLAQLPALPRWSRIAYRSCKM